MLIRALKLKMPDLSEKEIQEQIVGYLRLRGWEVSEIRERYAAGQGRYSQPGIPDVYCIKGGRSVWLEVKTRTGKVRPAQVEWHERHKNAGGEVYVVRSVEEAAEVCDKEDKDEQFF